MLINRDIYLNQLIARMHNGMIKIVSGIRRCGKSYLLHEIFAKYLLEHGVAKDHILSVRLDTLKDKDFQAPFRYMEYINNSVHDDKMYYLIIDEVQMMNDFVMVLNELVYKKNFDVYVTGSNSKFLSSDIVTEFRGRGDEIRVYPLNFAEYFSAVAGDWEDAWRQYCTFGGMPKILDYASDNDKMRYLDNLMQETYLKDIIDRNKVKNNAELEELLTIIASNIGGLTNPQKLADSFNSYRHNLNLTAPTVKQYLDYFIDSFIISRTLRYDIKGKRYINTPSKYYFTDIGLRNSRLDFRQYEENHIMENVIYNELKIRGYQVDVGDIKISENGQQKSVEVDFVANQGDKRIYIQSAFAMYSEEKRNQEHRPLLSIKDGFKKVIIVKDNIRKNITADGIIIIGLKDFLLNHDALDG